MTIFFPTLENSFSKVRTSCALGFGGIFKHTKIFWFFGFVVCYGTIYCILSIAFQKIFSKFRFWLNLNSFVTIWILARPCCGNIVSQVMFYRFIQNTTVKRPKYDQCALWKVPLTVWYEEPLIVAWISVIRFSLIIEWFNTWLWARNDRFWCAWSLSVLTNVTR